MTTILYENCQSIRPRSDLSGFRVGVHGASGPKLKDEAVVN